MSVPTKTWANVLAAADTDQRDIYSLPENERRERYCNAIGGVSAQISWALAAAEHGDMANVIKYLNKAQAELQPVYPAMKMGATPLYMNVLEPSYARQHSEEAF